MKTIKSLALAVCFIAALPNTVFSQDYILTVNNEEIQAKVLEIGLNEVVYKKFSNLDGPAYIISKSDIVQIIYQNGDIEKFNTQNNVNESIDETDIVVKKQQESISRAKFLSMNNREMSEYLLKNENGSIYKQFSRGKKLNSVGKTLWITGIPVAVTGVVLLWAGVSYSLYSLSTSTGSFYVGASIYDAGLALISVGDLLIAAGIPLHIIGKNKMKGAKRDYVNRYMSENIYKVKPSLDFGLTGNGAGFIINF
ncbi:MAG: hypothetical protein LBF01_00320 [Bacteroidales bacterium]|jgi:hypothetical protein|nr:hypothetical protein [Bacteroidales bacterium]